MDRSIEAEVEQLKNRKSELFDQNVLHILNGQAMYDEFKNNKLLEDSDTIPFNEAMCVHETTISIFDHAFIQKRAAGHNVTEEDYYNKVITPLTSLSTKNYDSIVLWFGKDMFCQMNLLTLLAYIEQSQFEGKVILNSFNEDEFKVSQTELTLGSYYSVYKEVLVNHKKPKNDTLPIMDQAVELFLELQTESNAVTRYIEKNRHLPKNELVKHLLELFPTVGYGDTQYLELIEKVK